MRGGDDGSAAPSHGGDRPAYGPVRGGDAPAPAHASEGPASRPAADIPGQQDRSGPAHTPAADHRTPAAAPTPDPTPGTHGGGDGRGVPTGGVPHVPSAAVPSAGPDHSRPTPSSDGPHLATVETASTAVADAPPTHTPTAGPDTAAHPGPTGQNSGTPTTGPVATGPVPGSGVPASGAPTAGTPPRQGGPVPGTAGDGPSTGRPTTVPGQSTGRPDHGDRPTGLGRQPGTDRPGTDRPAAAPRPDADRPSRPDPRTGDPRSADPRPSADRPATTAPRPDARTDDHGRPDEAAKSENHAKPENQAKPDEAAKSDDQAKSEHDPSRDGDAHHEADAHHDADTRPDEDTRPDADADTPAHERPLSDSRPYDTPGGLARVEEHHQQELERRIPRNPDGTPQRHPDPYGDWPGAVNGDGHREPGRDNNCLDVALSSADTYSGNPTAAAARTDDGSPDGERGGRDRAERQLGAPFRDLGNGDQAFHRLEDTLRQSGHGSQAVIVTQDANGRAHAWNVVNHNGKIVYLDNQTGARSDKPLHNGDHGVFAIPLDADRKPIPADRHGDGTGDRPGRDGEADRRPEDPAGKKKQEKHEHGKDAEDEQSLAEKHKDDPDHPIHEPARTEHERLADREDRDDDIYGVQGDDCQQQLRDTNDVRQVDMDHVHEKLHEWATDEDQSLAYVLHLTEGDDAYTFRRSDLAQALPGFGDMHPGEQGAVVAALGRMSHSFHEQHGVGMSPEQRDFPYAPSDAEGKTGVDQDGKDLPKGSTDPRSRGVVDHEKTTSEVALKQSDDYADSKEAIKEAFAAKSITAVLEAQGTHRPDFSGRNYAVMEVYDPVTKEISYVVDSSVPASGGDRKGVTPLHSETHLGGWMDRLNASRPEGQKYEVLSLYTEREPCGRGQGHADCSGYLADDHAGVPIHYATGYRKGDVVGPTGEPGKATPRQLMNRDFGNYVAKVGETWSLVQQNALNTQDAMDTSE
ncbi:toxin glutamine deamidase domain-containing protein [Kitasatospora sp. NPDC051914]|uniref:toxin glutamine deamidase domain-containing protein n=1 Tax=Kitasatospora sp. NPDC051914 TaxID=3154945 RepID=UPI0034130B7F